MKLKSTILKLIKKENEEAGYTQHWLILPGDVFISTLSGELVEGFKVGDYVEIEFIEKPSKKPDGKPFKNLVSIKKIEKTTEALIEKKEISDDRGKSIVKQVAYKVAVEAVEKLAVTDETSDEGLLRFLETVRKISHAVYLDIMQDWEQ